MIGRLEQLLADDGDAEIGRAICAEDAEAIVMTLVEDDSTVACVNALAASFDELRNAAPALLAAVKAADALRDGAYGSGARVLVDRDRYASLVAALAALSTKEEGTR